MAVFFVVLMDLMGFGIVLPLLPFYADKFNASSIMIGFLYSIYSLSQLFFSPLWGALSDRIGRRPVMLVSTFGSSFSYLIFALSSSLPLLFFSRMLAGVMGGNIATAQAYIADVTSPAERTRGMGILGAAFGIGFVIGPSLATLFIHPGFHRVIGSAGFPAASAALAAHSFAILGLFAMLLSLVSFLLVLFWLPESRVPGTSGAGSERAGVFSARFWRNLFSTGRSKYFLMLAGSALLLSLAHSSLYSAFPLFSRDRLGMSPSQVGTQYVIMGFIAVMIQGGLIRALARRFREESIFLAGCILMAAGLLLVPCSVSPRTLTIFLSFLAVGSSFNGPTLNSLVSKESDEDHLGATMGMVQGLSGLGRAIGPTWGGFLFGFSPSLPFYATACVVSFTVYVGMRMRRIP